MSKSIDNKVVSMEFDNSKFEKPAKESISTLDKLKEALHFKNVESGFEAMNHAIKKVTFDPLAKGIDTVYAKFTFFERFTIQLYDRLANKIIDTGKLIAKETFTAPISSGKSEYEEKMGSIQTIMASTGESLETVNKYLNELNKYSDDTIYSFRDMTNNIGKFTNAGVKLEDAVAAIKGVSNEAALSGANANEASRAMYNFAQALSTGSVKLIDWKSIENANMATVEFKKQLLETAADVGTLTKTSEDLYKTQNGHLTGAMHDFNGQLKDEWLTSEVLIKTLKKYADTKEDVGKRATAAATEVKTFSMMMDTLKEALQSGWAESWEHIFGDFEKAKQLWTDLSRVLGGLIDRMSTARNTMLKFWNENGGRIALIDGIKNAWKALTSILGAVRDGFRTVFPPMTGLKLVDLTKRFEAFTAKLRPTPVTIDKVRRTFAGLFSVIGIVIDGFKALYNVLMPLVGKAFKFITGELLSGTRSLGDWLFNLRETIKEGRVFETVFGKVGSVLAWLGSKLKAVFLAVKDIVLAFKNGGLKEGFGAIRDAFMNLFSSIWDFLKKHNPIEWVKELGVKIAEAIYDWPVGRAIVDFVKKVKDAIVNSPVWKFCVGVIQDFVDGVQFVINKFRGIDTSATDEFSEKVEEGFHPLVAIKNFFITIWNGILKVWEKIGPMMKSFGSAIATAFKNLYNDIRGVVNRSDMADAGVFGAGTGLGLMLISIAKFVHELSSTTKNASSTVKNLKKLTNGLLDLFRAFRLKAYAAAIKDTAISIGILAASLFVLSALPAGPLAQATGAILMLFTALTRIMKEMSALNSVSGGLGKSGILMTFGIQLAFMAAAILALVAAMVVLALIPYEGVLKGLAVLVLLMRSITSEIKKIAETTGSSKAAGILLAFAAFIQLLIVPLTLLSIVAYFNFEGLWKAAAVLIAFITVMSKVIGGLAKAASKWGANTVKIGGVLLGIGVLLVLITKVLMVLSAEIALLTAVGDDGALSFSMALDAIAIIFGLIITFIVVLIAEMALVKKYVGRIGGLDSLGITAPLLAALAGMAVVILAITAAVTVLTAAAKFMGVKEMKETLTYIGVLTGLIGLIAIAITGVSKASTKINGEATATFKNNKLSISLFPKIVSYVLAAAVMVVAVAAAAKIINGVDAGDVWAAVGVMTAVFALIAGIGVLSAVKGGFGERFSKGLATAGKAMSGFGKIILAFIVIIGLFLVAMALFLKNSDESLDSFAKMIESHKDQIINVVTDLIEIALTAALRSVFTALQTLSVETIKGLISVIDTLIEEGPELVARLLILVGVILDGIIDKAPEITEKLVQAIIAVLHGLGKAIYDHSTEIVDAIDKVIEAITAVWVKGIGKLFGIASKDLDTASEAVMGIAKPLTLVGTGLFAAMTSFNKVGTGVKTFTGLITGLKDKLGGISDGVSGFIGGIGKYFKGLNNRIKASRIESEKLYTAVDKVMTGDGSNSFIMKNGKEWAFSGYIYKETGNLATYAKQTAKKTVKDLGKIVSAHPILTAIVAATAAGKALAAVIDSATEKIEVISNADKIASAAAQKTREMEKEYNEFVSKREESYKTTQSEYELGKLYLEQLRDCVNDQGELIDGKKIEFNILKDKIAPYMQIILDETTNRVTAEDEYGQQLDITSEKLDSVYKKMMLQKQLQKAMEASEEAYTKVHNGSLDEAVNKAYEELQVAKNTKILVNKSFPDNENLYLTAGELSTLAAKSNEEIWNFFKQKGIDGWIGQNLVDAKEAIQDANGMMANVTNAYDNAVTNRKKYTAMSQNWEVAAKAVSGTVEEMEAALDIINSDVYTSKADATLADVEQQIDQTVRNIKTSILNDNFTDALRKKYTTELDLLLNDAEKLGADFGDYFFKGIEYAGGSAEDFVLKILNDPELNAKSRIKKIAKQYGIADVDGLINGISEEKGKLFAEWDDLTGRMIDNYIKVHKIRSPSKVFKQFGIYDVMGLIQGVTSKEDALNNTYSAMAASNIAAYTAAMSSNHSSFAFTPMINSSGIQNGTAAIQSQLNSLSATPLGATLTSQLAASVDTSQIDSDNSKILKALTDLLGGVGDLGTRMANLQIVMDTGATVGALAPGMDLELGRRAVRKGRGV